MHYFYRAVSLLTILLLLVSFGCSGGDGNITTPQNPDEIRDSSSEGGNLTSVWGMWEVSIEKSTGRVAITRERQADLALNVLGFMEPPILLNMSIDFDTLFIDPGTNYVGADVILTHPFVTPDGVFNGFDVRGIVFGPTLENADGLTRYFNPVEWKDVPFGYMDGLLGAPDGFAGYTELFNGFKYFADGIGLTETVDNYFSDPGNLANRGMFAEGSSNSRHYDLQFGAPATDFLVFNYAIGASYNWPAGDPPFVLDDFDVTTANQAEPVFMEINEINNSLWYNAGNSGGSLELEITIFDWVKPGVPEEVSVDGGTAFASTPAVFDSEVDANRRRYTFQIDGAPITSTDLDVVISATSSKTYGESYFLDLLPAGHALYNQGIETRFVHTVTVSDMPVENLCEDASGVPVFGIDEYLDPEWWGNYEDIAVTTDGRFIIHDNTDSFYSIYTTGNLLLCNYDPMPFPEWSGWTYVQVSGFNTTDVIIQIECDSDNNIITAYEGDDSFDVWDLNLATNAVTLVTTVFLVDGDILAMALDGDDNLWVMIDNYEVHKFDAGTYNHDTSATFDASANVYGWVWDFVVDPFDGKFYILHEDDGTGSVNDGVLSKYSAEGTYDDQLVGVFTFPIQDNQIYMENDPGEADIMIDDSDPMESSCRIICIADHLSGYQPLTQMARIRAADLSYIGTPMVDPDSWGISAGVIVNDPSVNPPILLVTESEYEGYIDTYDLTGGMVW